jgi:hypothetical protein
MAKTRVIGLIGISKEVKVSILEGLKNTNPSILELRFYH